SQTIKTCSNVQAGQCCTSDPITFGTAGMFTYTAMVTDNKMCMGSCMATVTVLPNPTVHIDCPSTPLACMASSQNLSATVDPGPPTSTIVWSVPSGPCTIDSGQGTARITFSDPSA